MIPKNSPEGQLLTVTWRTLLAMAGSVSEQFRFVLAGIAAILGLVVANLNSIKDVVDSGCLKWAVSLLVVSVVLAAAAYLMSTALKVRNDVVAQLEGILSSAEGQEVLSKLTIQQSELRDELCAPFWGPLKTIMKKASDKGAGDPYAVEKGGITLMLWQAYAMWLSIIVAAVGLFVLIFGLK